MTTTVHCLKAKIITTGLHECILWPAIFAAGSWSATLYKRPRHTSQENDRLLIILLASICFQEVTCLGTYDHDRLVFHLSPALVAIQSTNKYRCTDNHPISVVLNNFSLMCKTVNANGIMLSVLKGSKNIHAVKVYKCCKTFVKRQCDTMPSNAQVPS